jgi:putative acetyltransferase
VLTIRVEQPSEADAIHDVVFSAFASENEAQLVAKIRASENFVPAWSLVAEIDGDLVGHVMASYVELVDGDVSRRVPSLSPLSVAFDHQNRGIGSALVRALAPIVDEAGEPLMVLEGDPKYYSRFGFEFAPGVGIHIHLPSWAPPEAAQVLRLRSYDAAVKGQVVYPPAFNDVTDP